MPARAGRDACMISEATLSMEDSSFRHLTHLEKRLLLATLSPFAADGDFRLDDSAAHAEGLATLLEIVQLVTNGEYLSALRKCASCLGLSGISGSDGGKPTLAEIVDALHEAVSLAAAARAREGEVGDVAVATKCMTIMTCGVASLLLFTQANLTGPSFGKDAPPPSLASVFNPSVAASVGSAPVPSPGAGEDPEYRSALSLLELDGEDVPQLVSVPQFLVVAQTLLAPPALAALRKDPLSAHHGQQHPPAAGRGSAQATDVLPGLARTTLTPALMAKAKLKPFGTPEPTAEATSIGQVAWWPVTGSLWAARALLARQRLLSGRSPTLQQMLALLLADAHQVLGVEVAPPRDAQGARVKKRKSEGAAMSVALTDAEGASPNAGSGGACEAAEGMAVDMVAGASSGETAHCADVDMLDAAREADRQHGDPATGGGGAAGEGAACQWYDGDEEAPEWARGAALRPLLSSVLQLETSLMLLAYGRVEDARAKCELAAGACGLRMQVSGVMGFRTQHQEDAKAQLVLLVSSCANGLQPCMPADAADNAGLAELGTTAQGASENAQGASENAFGSSDILQHPRLLAGGGGLGAGEGAGAASAESGAGAGSNKGMGTSVPAATIVLSDLEQAIVLANAVLVKSSGAHGDELQQWEAIPFIEAITAQPNSCFMVKRMASLLRCRSERHRSRTRERSYLDLEQLVREVDTSSASVAHRMGHAFTVWLPLLTGLRKEMGEQMVAYGLVGEALSLFESLSLWDHAISCYRLLGKVNQCLHVVRERLSVAPDDPRLLCILGDLTKDDSCYLAAWDKSGKHYTRAKRSLARTAHERGEYEASVGHWEDALAINPLYPDAWFSLGYAAIKSNQFDKALHAYTRCTQLDPENAEAWNNIGTLAIKKGRKKEALVALSQALKYKRESWQLWDNYVTSAVDTGEYSKAIKGLHRLLDLTGGKKADLSALGKIVDAFAESKSLIATQGGAGSTGSEEDATRPSAGAAGSDGQAGKAEAEGGEEEEEEDLGHLSSVLLGDLPPGGGVRPREVLDGDEPPSPPKPRVLSHQERVALVRQLDKPLKDLLGKMAAIPSLGDLFWKVKGGYHIAGGEFISATECFLKQCRALQTSGWQNDKAKWSRMAGANLDLASSYLRWGQAASTASSTTVHGEGRPAVKLTPVTAKDFAAARMHLRSFLKQSEERYGEEDEYKAVEESLRQIQQAEERAMAT
eukprot:jgi/Mesvir1/8235/Mv12517-RA.1